MEITKVVGMTRRLIKRRRSRQSKRRLRSYLVAVIEILFLHMIMCASATFISAKPRCKVRCRYVSSAKRAAISKIFS